MTIRARVTQVDNHWSAEAEHDGRQVVAESRRLGHVDDMVRRAFRSEGVDIGDEAVQVVRTPAGRQPVAALGADDAAS